ncbi:Nucleolar protein 13 [Savitreella phatthalungensis]
MSSKRKEEIAELEVDVTAPAPPSKKQARAIKKGKAEAPKPDESLVSADGLSAVAAPPAKGTNGIWIGNLPYSVTEASLRDFFAKGTIALRVKEIDGEQDIVRVSLPVDKKTQRNKGFAYVDFASEEHRDAALKLTERIFDGRNVLIKSAQSFEGRPTKPSTSGETGDDNAADARNPSILFVGNLSFETTEASLSEFLGGEASGIKRVRLATFEDSGKCKGFAFILAQGKRFAFMDGRRLKLELGQDRSKRTPNMRNRRPEITDGAGIGRVERRHREPHQKRDIEQNDNVKGTIQKSTGTKIAF